MTQEAKLTLGDLLQDPNVPVQIKDYIRFKSKSFTPTDPTLLALQTTIKDSTKTVAERQAAVDQLIVLARQPDEVVEVIEEAPPQG